MNANNLFRLSLFSFTLIALICYSCGKEEVPRSSLILKDNLLYKRGSNVPFTGRERALVDNKIVDYEVKDGLKHGEFRMYSAEGNLEMSGQIDSNRNVGKWQYFYFNGKLESEGYFDYDKPDGKWIWNYPDGNRKEEGNFLKGKRVGIWYQFNEKGETIFEKNYDLEDSLKDSVNAAK